MRPFETYGKASHPYAEPRGNCRRARRQLTHPSRRDSEGAAKCAIESRLTGELMSERQIEDARVRRLSGCELPEGVQQVPFADVSGEAPFHLEEPVDCCT
jgi:hypothetical protein